MRHHLRYVIPFVWACSPNQNEPADRGAVDAAMDAQADGALDAAIDAAASMPSADAQPIDASPDAGRLDQGETGAPFGASCGQDGDCRSGVCIQLGALRRGICSSPCEGADCPPNAACLDAPDARRLCVPQTVCADFDGDDYGVGVTCLGPDCDDSNAAVRPGATEQCDGADQDCDDNIDEGLADEGQACNGGMGRCAAGWQTCVLGAWVCEPRQQPQDETCDGIDEDCDGRIDELLQRACGEAEGACEPGTSTCAAGEWQACVDQIGPVEEICNGLDDDCDGVVDDAVLLGGVWIIDPAWRGRMLAIGADTEQMQYGVAFSGLDNGRQTLNLSLVDPVARRVTQTVQLEADLRVTQVRVQFIAGHWWVTALLREGSDRARVHIYRVDPAGNVAGDPTVIGPEIDTYVLRAADHGIMFGHGGGLVELNAQAQVLQTHPVGVPDQELVALPDGWLIGTRARRGFDTDYGLRPWRNGDWDGPGHRVPPFGFISRMFLLSTTAGMRLVSVARLFGPPRGAVDIHAVQADGSLERLHRLFEGEDRGSLWGASDHGAGGFVFWERFNRPDINYRITRIRADDVPVTLRAPLAVDDRSVQQFDTADNDGPLVVHGWTDPVSGETRLSRSAMEVCE